MISEQEILKASILIVDDQRSILLLLKKMLREAGYSCIETTMDPHDVCELHRNNRYDLILLDLLIPGMDGLKLMEGLKEIETDNYLPVLVITAKEGQKLRALSAGAKDFVTKPFDLDEVQIRIHNMLEVRLLYKKLDDYNKALEQMVQKRAVELHETATLLHRNQTLMQNSMDGIHVMDMQGNIVEANDAFCNMLGYTHEEMARLNVADWDAQWTAEELRERFKWLIGKNTRFETIHRRKDGSLINVEVSTSGMKIEGQDFLFAASRDITERKLAEAALRESEKRRHLLEQHEIVQTSLDGFWMVNAKNGQILEVNENYCKAVGYSQEEILAMRIHELDANETPEETAAHIKKIWEIGYDRFETRHHHKQGHLVDFDVSASNSGMGDGINIAFFRDITERKRSEELLRKSFGEIEDLYNQAACGYHSLDKDGLILRINDTELSWLGYARDEVVGKMKLTDFLTPESVQIFRKTFPRLIEQGFVHDIEIEIFRGDGTILVGLVNASAIYDSSGNFVMSRSAIVDITERMQAEKTQKELSRALKLLSECGTLMIHANNEQELLDKVCQLAVETGGYQMAWVGFAENDLARTVRPIAKSGYEEGYLGSIKVTWSDTEHGQGPTGTAIRTRAAAVNLECQTNPNMAPWREAAIKRGYQSSIGLPLVSNNQVLGALTIYSVEPLAFSDEEVALLKELADNLSYGIGTLRTQIAKERAELESRELSKHLLTVREEEKAGFAREIHDELGSTLAALKMDTSWMAGKLPNEEKMAPLQERVKSMAHLLETAMIATRRIIADLRPGILDDHGLLAAIKWQATQFNKRSGIECRVVCTNDECRSCQLDKTISINLFRIFQESLTNVARHSGASRVDVEIQHDDDEVTLSISDNGCGLPQEHSIASTSYGIRGMRERAEQLGGTIKFDTAHGGGFRVTAKLPLHNESQ